MGEADNVPERTPSRRPIGGLLAFVPIFSFFIYLYAYSFEIGYALQFEYPRDLISFNPSIISNFFAIHVLFILFLFGFLALNLQYWPFSQRYIVAIILGSVTFYLVFIIFWRFFPGWLSMAMLFSSGFALFGGRVLFRRRSTSVEPGSPDRLPNIYDRRSEVHEGTIAYFFLHRMGFDPLLYIFIFFLLIPGVFCLNGYLEAYKKMYSICLKKMASNSRCLGS